MSNNDIKVDRLYIPYMKSLHIISYIQLTRVEQTNIIAFL